MKNTFLFAVVLCSFFAACTPAQRLSRLQRKHPELFTKDTIHIHDTTYVPRVQRDTVFRQSMVKDTVIVQKDRLTMRYFYNNDSVFLSGTCKDTTIIKEIQVTTEKAIITEGKTPQWKNYLLIAGWILVAVLFLLLLIRR